MAWIAGLLLMLFILYAIPAFRDYVSSLVVGTSVILISFYFYEKQHKTLAEQIVPLSKIEVLDINLYGPLHPFKMNSTLRNNSHHVVETVDLSIFGFDCPASYAELDHCEMIGESIVTLEGSISPGSTEQYGSSVNFDRMPDIQGKFVWQYQIKTVRSELGAYAPPASLRASQARLSSSPR